MATFSLPLTVDDVLGRRLSVLGVVRMPWDQSNNNVVRNIFTVGNIGYPSPGRKAYVPYVALSSSTGLAPPVSACVLQIGVGGDSTWSNGGIEYDSGAIANFGANGLLNSWSLQTAGGGSAPALVAGQVFTIKNVGVVSDATAPFLTVTAIGWAE